MYIADKTRYKQMKYKKCGNSGLLLPKISLGLWHNFGGNASDAGFYKNYEKMKEMCFTAFDNGITHFDIANNYGLPVGSAELNFGNILRENLLSHRDELIISTKAGYLMWDGPYGDGGSRKYLISSIDQSLKRLQLDYVDIFYHHRMDKDTPLEETMSALSQIVRTGKALYIGLSNYDGKTLEKATEILDSLNCPFIINQNRYSILDRAVEKNDLLKNTKKLGKGLIVYSPLAQGRLSDRYLNGIPDDSRVKTDNRFLSEKNLDKDIMDKIRQLDKLARERGEKLATMALAFLLQKEEVSSVLIGASKKEQIIENIKSIHSPKLSKCELEKIDNIMNMN